MIENDLYAYLSTYPGLVALVGTRVYPVQAPKKVTHPYVVFFKVSNVRETSHQGFASLQKSRIQISCYADRYYTDGFLVGVKQIAEQVILAMEAWTGQLHIQASHSESEQDLIDLDTNLYHVSLDFFITYGDAAGSGWSPSGFIVDLANKIATFTFQGTLSEDMISARIHFLADVNIIKLSLHAQDAPEGSSITVDILKNSTAQGRVAVLEDGLADQETNITPIVIASTDEFALQVLSVGSDFAGAGLEVKVYYT